MIVHMTRLYTRLVTYARLYILTSVVCLQFYQLLFICSLVHVIDQVFNETGHVARSWSFLLPILILLSSFSFHLILQFFLVSIHCYQSLFLFCIHVISCVGIRMLYCSDIDRLFLACSGYLGLAYMRRVFCSRTYVVDSRRDSVFTYFGKRA